MIDDVQRAADLLHPIYENSDGLDGFASLELDPTLTEETVCAVATARRLLARIDRGNVMVEMPATRQGIAAFETLTADGVSDQSHPYLFRQPYLNVPPKPTSPDWRPSSRPTAYGARHQRPSPHSRWLQLITRSMRSWPSSIGRTCSVKPLLPWPAGSTPAFSTSSAALVGSGLGRAARAAPPKMDAHQAL